MKYTPLIALFLLIGCAKAPTASEQDAKIAKLTAENLDLRAKVTLREGELKHWHDQAKNIRAAVKNKNLFKDTETLSVIAGDVVAKYTKDDQDIWTFCNDRAVKVTGFHRYFNETENKIFTDRGDFPIGLPVGEFPSELINACALVLHSDEF